MANEQTSRTSDSFASEDELIERIASARPFRKKHCALAAIEFYFTGNVQSEKGKIKIKSKLHAKLSSAVFVS